jgi:recombination protein RecA
MKRSVATVTRSIQKKYGTDVIGTMKGQPRDIPRISTGIDSLDDAIGGGIPRGRIIEIYGPESAGKTSLAFQIAAQSTEAIFFDMEHTFDPDRAATFGVSEDSMMVSRPMFGEHVFEQMFKYAEAGIDLMIIDSIPAMIPRAVWDQKDIEKNPGVAMIPRLMSVRLPELVHLAHKSGTTVIFINQIREKIGIVFPTFGNTQTPGGRAFKHFVSLRLQVNRKGFLEGPKKSRIGYIMRTQVTKSKVCAPTGDVDIPMLFDEGFVTHERVAEKRKELKT